MLGMIVYENGDTPTALELLGHAQRLDDQLRRRRPRPGRGLSGPGRARQGAGGAAPRVHALTPRLPLGHMQAALCSCSARTGRGGRNLPRAGRCAQAGHDRRAATSGRIAYHDGRIGEAAEPWARRAPAPGPAPTPTSIWPSVASGAGPRRRDRGPVAARRPQPALRRNHAAGDRRLARRRPDACRALTDEARSARRVPITSTRPTARSSSPITASWTACSTGAGPTRTPTATRPAATSMCWATATC